MSGIVVFGIDLRQGYKLFKVVPLHLILVAWICVCINIGSLDWVIEALRQIDWILIKFKSTVCWSSLASDFSFSHSNLVITFLFGNYSESQLSQIVVFGIGMRQGCKLFKVVPPHPILVARICVCIYIGSLIWVIEALRQINWFLIKFKSTNYWLSLARFLFQSSKFGHHIPATATSSQRAPRELPGSSQRAPIYKS